MFIGYTNFSVLRFGATGWQESSNPNVKNQEAYKARLFDSERLALRSFLFFRLSLPQLAKAAEGHDLVHIVAYSRELPQRYKDMLLEAERKYPFLVLDELDNGVPTVLPQDIAKVRALKEPLTFITYNLDDDDVLGKSFFKRLEQYKRRDLAGFRVSLASGYSAITEDNIIYDLRLKRVPLNNWGLASICSVSPDGTEIFPPASGHDTCDQKGPVILDSTGRTFLQLRHVSQDTESRFEVSESRDRLLNQSRHLRKIESFSAFVDEFPEAAKYVTQEQNQELLTRPVVLKEEYIDLSLPGQPTSFDLAFFVEDEDRTERGELLASFVLGNGEGTEVNNVGPIGMTSYSDKTDVKYHFFPKLEGSLHERSFSFRMPEGIRCLKVRLHNRANTPRAIVLNKVTLTVREAE